MQVPLACSVSPAGLTGSMRIHRQAFRQIFRQVASFWVGTPLRSGLKDYQARAGLAVAAVLVVGRKRQRKPDHRPRAALIHWSAADPSQPGELADGLLSARVAEEPDVMAGVDVAGRTALNDWVVSQ
jgi:hypothetical protein